MTDAPVAQDDYYVRQAVELFDQLSIETLAGLLRDKEAYREQAQLPEAAGSCNAYLIGPGGSEILVTSRGVSLNSAWDQMVEFIKLRMKEGYRPMVKYTASAPADAQSKPAQSAPTTNTVTGGQVTVPGNNAGTSSGEVIPLTKLYANTTGGKTYWKIEGGRFKFPITVWPEVLQTAGFAVDKLNPSEVIDLTRERWMGQYEPNEKGFPKKITRMYKG